MSVTRAVSRLMAAGVMFASAAALASSHREAPLISNDPAADGTDLYAFRSPAAAPAVVLVANYYPAAIPLAGPNYYLFDDSVLYEIKIDNVGDAKPHVIYQFRFSTKLNVSPLPGIPAGIPGGTGKPGNSFLNYWAGVNSPTDSVHILRQQTYSVTKVTYDAAGMFVSAQPVGTNLPVCPWPVGKVTNGAAGDFDAGYGPVEAACNQTGSGAFVTTKIFAGPRDDPFWVDLHRIFDFLALDTSTPADSLAGLNVMSLVLEVPVAEVTGTGLGKIGVWTTSSRPRVTVRRGDGTVDGHGNWVQVSRLGNPLVNEVVVPLRFKDYFNASKPEGDAIFAPVVLDPELPYLMNAKGFIGKVPPPPRTDLVKALLLPFPGIGVAPPVGQKAADVLHLDTTIAATPFGTQSNLGLAGGDLDGFPNGRRLRDDITDIELKVVGGYLYNALGAQKGVPDGGVDAGDTYDYQAQSANISQGVPANDVPFQPNFPYLATPHAGNP